MNLRSHDVDAGDHLRDGVLHLHARVHFNEVPTAGVHVHQELHRPGIVVAGRTRQLHCRLPKLLANPWVQIHCRRHLHHLLMTALHRAVPLIQVHDIAVPVSQNLHFDVLGALDIPFQEHCVVAERR